MEHVHASGGPLRRRPRRAHADLRRAIPGHGVVDAAAAVAACEQAIQHLGRRPSLVHSLGRALNKRDGNASSQQLDKYKEAADLGYPMGFNNVGVSYDNRGQRDDE